MSLPDYLTVARAVSVPFVVALFVWDFSNHYYWATALFAVAMATDWFDGRIARRRGVGPRRWAPCSTRSRTRSWCSRS